MRDPDRIHTRRRSRLFTLALGAVTAACTSVAPDVNPYEPVVIARDGGWCWFQDERAIMYYGRVLIGLVSTGWRNLQRTGDVSVVSWDPKGGEPREIVLAAGFEKDDHAAPALVELSTGAVLAMYTQHGNDEVVRWRSAWRPDQRRNWSPEDSLRVSRDPGVTYSNLVRLDEAGVVLDFCRATGWDPNVLVSRDDGLHWEHVGRLLGGPGRPYLKYVGDGRRSVHFVATEQHPRDFDNGIWHGVLRDKGIYGSDGTLIGAIGPEPPAPTELTPVFRGRPDAVAWTVDLELDSDGHPVTVFTVQRDGAGQPPGRGGFDHRFYYARWNGTRWNVQELAYAGTRLYAGEDDYTGLAAIDPDDPWVVFLSTDAHPVTGRPLISVADDRRHRELYRAQSLDEGETWTFELLTPRSTVDHLRPIVPRGDGEDVVLLWLRGTYRSYTDYDLEVVGRVLGPDGEPR